MKKKTINSVICKKFDEFLYSIKDDNVKKLVEQNTIISGGCIASMLMQEDINDFDLYFTNKETVLAVAKYYVNQFIDLAESPMFKGDKKDILIRVVDGDILETYTDLGTNPGKGRVKIHIKSSGIAGEKGSKDYQYFENRPPEEGEQYIENIISNIKEEEPQTEESLQKYRPIFLSANAITLSNKVQIVIRFYGEPSKIHENYDYIHCTNFWYSKERELVLKQDALESILSKELIYVGSKYPICSVIRIRKFLKRGWTINAGQILKQCFQISKLDLTNIEVLEDQLIGVDVAYFQQLIENIKKVSDNAKKDGKPFVLEFGYLATIIDKMF